MAPSKNTKPVQNRLPNFFKTVKDSRVVKSTDASKTQTKLPRLRQQTLLSFTGQTAQILRDDGEETLGSGEYKAVCSVKTFPKNSSVFFEGPIKEVSKEEGAAEVYRREAEDYPVVHESIVVKCKDGAPMLYFIKGGMFAGLDLNKQQESTKTSTAAIQALTKVYPPIPPKPDDSRVDQHEAQKEKWRAMGKEWGRLHLMYHYGIGRPDLGPMLHKHANPAGEKRLNAVKSLMEATTWEHNQVAKWISVLDPRKYEQLHKRYQEIGPDKLKHLYQGPEACHSGLVVLVNMAVGPHKDPNDARDNWTTTNCWGDFKGGHIVFPELGIKIAQMPGDLILSHAAVLTHFLEEVQEGERFCNVRFTKKNVLQPPTVKPRLGIPCPVADCPRSQPAKYLPSWGGLRTHLGGPTGQKKRLAAIKAARGTYHFLDEEDTAYMMSQAEATFKEATMENADIEMSDISDD